MEDIKKMWFFLKDHKKLLYFLIGVVLCLVAYYSYYALAMIVGIFFAREGTKDEKIKEQIAAIQDMNTEISNIERDTEQNVAEAKEEKAKEIDSFIDADWPNND